MNRLFLNTKQICDLLNFDRVEVEVAPSADYWIAETWAAVYFEKAFDDLGYELGHVDNISQPSRSVLEQYRSLYTLVYKTGDNNDWETTPDERGFVWRSPATMPAWANRLQVRSSADGSYIERLK